MDRIRTSAKMTSRTNPTSRSRLWCAGRAVRRLQRVERALRGLTFRAVRVDRDDLFPGRGRACKILLAEGFDDAEVQQRLRMLRIEFERRVESCERFVGLVRVVIADAEVGAQV